MSEQNDSNIEKIAELERLLGLATTKAEFREHSRALKPLVSDAEFKLILNDVIGPRLKSMQDPAVLLWLAARPTIRRKHIFTANREIKQAAIETLIARNSNIDGEQLAVALAAVQRIVPKDSRLARRIADYRDFDSLAQDQTTRLSFATRLFREGESNSKSKDLISGALTLALTKARNPAKRIRITQNLRELHQQFFGPWLDAHSAVLGAPGTEFLLEFAGLAPDHENSDQPQEIDLSDLAGEVRRITGRSSPKAQEVKRVVRRAGEMLLQYLMNESENLERLNAAWAQTKSYLPNYQFSDFEVKPQRHNPGFVFDAAYELCYNYYRVAARALGDNGRSQLRELESELYALMALTGNMPRKPGQQAIETLLGSEETQIAVLEDLLIKSMEAGKSPVTTMALAWQTLELDQGALNTNLVELVDELAELVMHERDYFAELSDYVLSSPGLIYSQIVWVRKLNAMFKRHGLELLQPEFSEAFVKISGRRTTAPEFAEGLLDLTSLGYWSVAREVALDRASYDNQNTPIGGRLTQEELTDSLMQAVQSSDSEYIKSQILKTTSETLVTKQGPGVKNPSLPGISEAAPRSHIYQDNFQWLRHLAALIAVIGLDDTRTWAADMLRDPDLHKETRKRMARLFQTRKSAEQIVERSLPIAFPEILDNPPKPRGLSEARQHLAFVRRQRLQDAGRRGAAQRDRNAEDSKKHSTR